MLLRRRLTSLSGTTSPPRSTHRSTEPRSRRRANARLPGAGTTRSRRARSSTPSSPASPTFPGRSSRAWSSTTASRANRPARRTSSFMRNATRSTPPPRDERSPRRHLRTRIGSSMRLRLPCGATGGCSTACLAFDGAPLSGVALDFLRPYELVLVDSLGPPDDLENNLFTQVLGVFRARVHRVFAGPEGDCHRGAVSAVDKQLYSSKPGLLEEGVYPLIELLDCPVHVGGGQGIAAGSDPHPLVRDCNAPVEALD